MCDGWFCCCVVGILLWFSCVVFEVVWGYGDDFVVFVVDFCCVEVDCVGLLYYFVNCMKFVVGVIYEVGSYVDGYYWVVW